MKKLFALFLALLFLCACAKPTRVSEEEKAALRERYPANDDVLLQVADGALESDTYPDYETWLSYMSRCSALVVMKIQSDWFPVGLSEKDPETGTYHFGDVSWLSKHFFWGFEAEVEQVLWQNPDGDAWLAEPIQNGDILTIGTSVLLNERHLSLTYVIGNRYVCFLQDYRKDEKPYEDVNFFRTGTASTFHLTDDDVLVSAISAPGADFCTGMYLDAFTEMVKKDLETAADALAD